MTMPAEIPSDAPPAVRDARGRFRPGCSGNPAGKPVGAVSWKTRLKGVVDEADFAAVARKTVEKAKAGSGVDARFLIAHLDPRPKVAPIEVPTEGSLVERYRTLWDAMATGAITPDQALAAGRVLGLERQATAAEPAIDPAARRAALEATIRAELTAELRAEVIAEIRAEVIAEIRAEIVRARDAAGAVAPPAPPAEQDVLKNPCISGSPPAAAPPTLTLPTRATRRAARAPAMRERGNAAAACLIFPSPAPAGEGGAPRAAWGG
jgi:hypothetical protein